MRSESDFHKSISEPRLDSLGMPPMTTNTLRPSPSAILSRGADSPDSNTPTMRPRLLIDRPVWTVADCYQNSKEKGFTNDAFTNDLGESGEVTATGGSGGGGDDGQGGGGGGGARVGGVSPCGFDEKKGGIPTLAEAGAQIKKKIHKTRDNVCTPEKILRAVISLFPCIGWMRTYVIKEYLMYDIISGITSAIFHVPQGMANALANMVSPVYGLYGSFFPSAVYSVMGTSMQCSVGTFTVVSIITANAVLRLATVDNEGNFLSPPGPAHGPPHPPFPVDHNDTGFSNATGIPPLPGRKIITPIQVTVAVTLLSGVVQVLMGVLRCGRLGILISPSLASGFMTGCAVQIIASQLKGCFNLKFKDFTGILNVINTIIAVIENIIAGNANVITTIMSICVCAALIIGKDLIGPKFQRMARIPLPVDVIMVIVCTLASYYLELNKKYEVPIVNHIPSGLPSPVLPVAELLPKVIGDAIPVAIVGFASTFSMGKTFARRYNHEVDANQELLALGCGNILGGFFLCIPGCGSLARSSVMESVGCKTQLTGMISCVFLALVLYFIGPLLEPLPKCVLATILATALKGYLVNIIEVKKLWNVSKADAIIWVTTCLSTIILDVTYGLMVGVIITLLSITWRMQGYRGILLREVKTSGIFLPKNKKKKVNLSPDQGRLILFRFGNPLCFATAANFVADVKRIIKQIQQVKPCGDRIQNAELEHDARPYLVVDLSSSCFVDNTGIEALQEGLEKCRKWRVEFCLAAVPHNLMGALTRSGTLDMIGHENVFPTIQDAVLACTNKINMINYDNISASVSFNNDQTDVGNGKEPMYGNSLEVPNQRRDSPSGQSDLGLLVKDLEGGSDDTASGSSDELDDYSKRINFTISENGRTQRASIVSNAGGQVLRSSYL